MRYPVKTLSQLSLFLKGFRKEKGLSQAVMGEKLGITQQSYAYFEANPAVATFERLFKVLRLLGVEISLDPVFFVTDNMSVPSVDSDHYSDAAKATLKQKRSKAAAAITTNKVKSPGAAEVNRIVMPERKKENW